MARPKPTPHVTELPPSVSTGKQSVTIRLDRSTVDHFKRIASQTGIRYQTLINLYLRDCAATGRALDLTWQGPRRSTG